MRIALVVLDTPAVSIPWYLSSMAVNIGFTGPPNLKYQERDRGSTQQASCCQNSFYLFKPYDTRCDPFYSYFVHLASLSGSSGTNYYIIFIHGRRHSIFCSVGS